MIKTLYEIFQPWSAKGSIYILSDLHLGDADCRLMDPDWIAPEEQIQIINKKAKTSDTFICLGDVGDPAYAAKIRAGHKVLILGNHDRRKDYVDIFNEIYEGPLLISEKILLSHEPVYGLPWCLNIHGHDHNGKESYAEDCKHLNLAANVCGYTPVSLGQLIKDGALSGITGIHRLAIEQAKSKKEERDNTEPTAAPPGVKTAYWIGSYTPYRCSNCGRYSDSITEFCSRCGRYMLGTRKMEDLNDSLEKAKEEIRQSAKDFREGGEKHADFVRHNGEMVAFGLEMALEILEEHKKREL